MILYYLWLRLQLQSLWEVSQWKCRRVAEWTWADRTVVVTVRQRRSYFEGWYWIKRRASSLSNTPWINSPSATRSGGEKGKDIDEVILLNEISRSNHLSASVLVETRVFHFQFCLDLSCFSPLSLLSKKFQSLSALFSAVFSSEGSRATSSFGMSLKMACLGNETTNSS